MATIKAHTLSGFMELLPAPQTQMERLLEVLRSSYGVYGFTPLDTPIIEASDVLLAKGGGETEKQIYRFSKGDSDLSLRFDLTVPLAKYVALHYADLASPSAASRSARSTAASARSAAASASSIRRISTSSAMASLTSRTTLRSQPSSIRSSPVWASNASRSASTTAAS